MDKRQKNGRFAKGRKLKPENHPRWKGGLPRCSVCGVKLSTRKNKLGLCRKCFYGSIKGQKALNWRGGKKNNNGYVMIYKPLHPNSDLQGYVREHRLVAEKLLQRYLTKDEIVHHKNGIRDDNREENLQILDKRKHDILNYKNREINISGRFI